MPVSAQVEALSSSSETDGDFSLGAIPMMVDMVLSESSSYSSNVIGSSGSI